MSGQTRHETARADLRRLADGPKGGPGDSAFLALSGRAAALDIRNVSYRAPRAASRQGAVLVRDISFSIEQGEVAALIGPNGAGKTTLIRMVAGLARPNEGDILIAGSPVHAMSFAERAKRIAYVGQSDEPDGRLSLEHYVALGFLPHSRPFAGNGMPDQAREALSAVGLGALADRRLDRLSGGERQKAKIARALCQRPTLLVLDEPTNHLDPQARGELLSLVASMGIPVLAALHDLTLIDAFADKVAVMAHGELTAFGPPRETLSASLVQAVFGVELHRLPHPDRAHAIPALDIGICRSSPTIPAA